MKYEKLSKRALGCMYVATALASVIALAVIGAVNWLWIFPKDMDMLKAVSLALVILTLFDALASPYFRYHRYRYSINEECIDIKEGYLFVKRNIVPIERLHKLQTLKGPIDVQSGKGGGDHRRRRCHDPVSGGREGRTDSRELKRQNQRDRCQPEGRGWGRRWRIT